MTTETLAEAAIEQNIKQFLLVLSVSLSIATLPQFFSWFRQIPYTLLLVIVGLGLAFVDVRLVNLSPQLILTIFLPPLLFEAAWNMEWTKLKRDLVPITLFAILGVVISVIGVGFALNQAAGVTIGIALLLGACVAATDPVSVIALFRELGVEKRLTILMEGESLFNDGIAVVAFSFVVGFALGTDTLEIQELIARFFTVVGIGIGCGCIVGFGISYLTQRFDLPLVEQSLTLVSAYGTYIITEDLGGSGVIGVVTTGLVLGNFGSRIGMQPSTRLAVTQFWDFLAFFVNSIVFLLIGDQIKFEDLGANLGLIAITLAAMSVTRAIAIYGLSWLSNLLAKSDISLSDGTILWWGGLRGSVAIALALSVPVTLPQRTQIIAVVFGVVLFTLLVQGLTTKPLVTKLTPLGDQAVRQEYLEAIARWVAMNRVLNYLTQANGRPEIDPEFYRYQKALVEGQLDDVQQDMDKLRNEHPQLREFAVEQLQEELLAIEADTYSELVRGGRLSDKLPPMLEEVFKQMNKQTT
ncbi:Na+/H+ antiporter [Gloeocapsopsis dulcis]|uniref:Na+/H+ antiporter n=1 Tax=Gloeocapsopsis dulcis AAB1 = 1H9 TaxID=1433147 RepID=A0A6N8FU34_9CHRO|nr:Na+/H+ antiporter [Gloeocapsopsis dulcis]MUL36379.1 Na+/H+ antiporter [Gloeocapsopsis dulcis AAB1 = 1H9]WNN88125.1 Na+/H+ antiporter [Gloeocapsopsis dulcis]